MSSRHVLTSVLKTELRILVRDRRALLTAVVLPMVLYPLLFFGMDRLERSSETTLTERAVRVAHDLGEWEGDLSERVLEAWRRPSLRLELEPLGKEERSRFETGSPEQRSLGELQAIAIADRSDDGRPRLRLFVDRSQTMSSEARRRLEDSLRELRGEWRTEILAARFGSDPGRAVLAERIEFATADAAAGRELGRLLPLIAVILIISAGSFAALDAFAGEREAGTLETLLVQPVPAGTVATGKFLTVLLTALVVALGNATSFWLSHVWGLVGQETGGTLDPLRLLGALGAFAPAILLLTAVLCLVAARAKSFREGQNYVLPLVLVAAVPAALSMIDQVTLNVPLALIPIAGSTLAMRDVLAGGAATTPLLVSFVATLGWAGWALSGLARTLDAERLLATASTERERGQRKLSARVALFWGMGSVLVVYVVGGRLQSAAPVLGLVLTLGLIVPLLALLAGRRLARLNGERLTTALGLTRPSMGALPGLIGAPLLAPLLVDVMRWVLEQQARLMPAVEFTVPPGFEELGSTERLLLLALLPGVAEELLFRGALLRGLRRDLPAVRAVLIQGLLFGLVHASVYRLLPAGLMGLCLGGIALRTRSLWPCVLLHSGYNAVLGLEWRIPGALPLGLAGLVLLAISDRSAPQDPRIETP